MTSNLRASAIPFCLAAVLAACGGSSAPPPPSVPQGVSVLAGSIAGPGHVDGDAVTARLEFPAAIAVNAGGTAIGVIDGLFPRTISASGTVTTALPPQPGSAVGGPMSIALAGDGAYWISGGGRNLRRVSAAGEQFPVPPPSGFLSGDVASDAQGNAYVAAQYQCAAWKVTPALTVTLLAGVPDECDARDGPHGDARLGQVAAIASDPGGALYVLETHANLSDFVLSVRVRKIAPDGSITTIAGGTGDSAKDGHGLDARFGYSSQIAADGLGNVYVLDDTGIRRIDAQQNVTTLAVKYDPPVRSTASGIVAVAPEAVRPFDIAADAQGTLYLADAFKGVVGVLRPGSNTVTVLAGQAVDGTRRDGQGTDARFDSVRAAALDGNGDVLVPSFDATAGLAIRRVTRSGAVTTRLYPQAAGSGFAGTIAGHAYDLVRGVHYFVAAPVCSPQNSADCQGGNTIWRLSADGQLKVFAGDGGYGHADGQGTAARFNYGLVGPVLDGGGNLYVGDSNTVRKITPEGAVSTVAGPLVTNGIDDSIPYPRMAAIGVDGNGTVIVLTWYGVLMKVTQQGVVTNFASLVETNASSYPYPSTYQMPVDSAGNVYVGLYAFGGSSLPQPGKVVRVSPNGTSSLIAGGDARTGIVPGPLPGAFYAPTSLLSTDDGLVIGSGFALLRIVP